MPIALKIMATDHLEEDLSVAVAAGFDVIVIDGAEGGSHATAPVKQDDFGIPGLYALCRARRYLKNTAVSLVISGGYFTPGQCLKALALGADAIYLGTIPLLALVHNQITKVSPWEPPTTLVYYNSPSKTQLTVDQAATSVVNVFTSMVLEMEEAMRALGKASLKEFGDDDLVALDAITAGITGVKQALSPASAPPPTDQDLQQPDPAAKQCRESLEQFRQCLDGARQAAQLIEITLLVIYYSIYLSRLPGVQLQPIQ